MPLTGKGRLRKIGAPESGRLRWPKPDNRRQIKSRLLQLMIPCGFLPVVAERGCALWRTIGGCGSLAPFPAKPVCVVDVGSFVEHVEALRCVDGTYDFVVCRVELRGADFPA
jgi:hypothetical protein